MPVFEAYKREIITTGECIDRGHSQFVYRGVNGDDSKVLKVWEDSGLLLSEWAKDYLLSNLRYPILKILQEIREKVVFPSAWSVEVVKEAGTQVDRLAFIQPFYSGLQPSNTKYTGPFSEYPEVSATQPLFDTKEEGTVCLDWDDIIWGALLRNRGNLEAILKYIQNYSS